MLGDPGLGQLGDVLRAQHPALGRLRDLRAQLRRVLAELGLRAPRVGGAGGLEHAGVEGVLAGGHEVDGAAVHEAGHERPSSSAA